jgi:phosphoribosylanthranilate isomerase
MKPLKSLQVKLCGFTDLETIKFASKFDIDFMGFIFYEKSPRNFDLKEADNVNRIIPANIKKVAVFVDADDEKIEEVVKKLKPDVLQLHGQESPERLQQIKKKFFLPIIKAFRVSSKEDLVQVNQFENVADYFLFDAKVANEAGGTGQVFDWEILKNLQTKRGWFLSGGVNSNNIRQIIKETNAAMIDLSSSLEEQKGLKSKKLIADFVENLYQLSKQ